MFLDALHTNDNFRDVVLIKGTCMDASSVIILIARMRARVMMLNATNK